MGWLDEVAPPPPHWTELVDQEKHRKSSRRRQRLGQRQMRRRFVSGHPSIKATGDRDRSLRGKARIRARKAANRASRR